MPQLDSRSDLPADPLLSVRALTWNTRQRHKQGMNPILDDVQIDIHQGEFIGLIGPNGAGKTSLIKQLYRIRPDADSVLEGDIVFKGKRLVDYRQKELARSLAVLAQESWLDFEMTVFQMVSMGLTPHKGLWDVDSQQDIQRVHAALSRVHLQDKHDVSVHSLSGGERQRALIARVMVQDPELLILDEPTNHLDVRHQVEVMRLAKDLGVTVLASIHDINLAAAFCDRLILLNQGRVQVQGTVQEVLQPERLEAIFGLAVKIDQSPFHAGLRVTFDTHPSPQFRAHDGQLSAGEERAE